MDSILNFGAIFKSPSAYQPPSAAKVNQPLHYGRLGAFTKFALGAVLLCDLAILVCGAYIAVNLQYDVWDGVDDYPYEDGLQRNSAMRA